MFDFTHSPEFKGYIAQVKEELYSKGRVRIPKLGTLFLTEHKETTKRNIHTGELYTVPACQAIRFVPAKNIKPEKKH